MTVSLTLNPVGHLIAPGHVVRLAISQTLFPTVWPTATLPALTLRSDSCTYLDVPLHEGPLQAALPAQLPTHHLPQPMSGVITVESGKFERSQTIDYVEEVVHITTCNYDGTTRMTTEGIEHGGFQKVMIRIRCDGDPLSVVIRCENEESLRFDSTEYEQECLVRATTEMSCDRDHWFVESTVRAYLAGNQVAERLEPRLSIPRDHM